MEKMVGAWHLHLSISVKVIEYIKAVNDIGRMIGHDS